MAKAIAHTANVPANVKTTEVDGAQINVVLVSDKDWNAAAEEFRGIQERTKVLFADLSIGAVYALRTHGRLDRCVKLYRMLPKVQKDVFVGWLARNFKGIGDVLTIDRSGQAPELVVREGHTVAEAKAIVSDDAKFKAATDDAPEIQEKTAATLAAETKALEEHIAILRRAKQFIKFFTEHQDNMLKEQKAMPDEMNAAVIELQKYVDSVNEKKFRPVRLTKDEAIKRRNIEEPEATESETATVTSMRKAG